MAQLGMDIDAVTQHGTSLKHIGDNDLPQLIVRVDALIGDIQNNWWGQDAQQFHSSWTSTFRPSFQTIANAISGYGQSAVINAQAQQQVSS